MTQRMVDVFGGAPHMYPEKQGLTSPPSDIEAGYRLKAQGLRIVWGTTKNVNHTLCHQGNPSIDAKYKVLIYASQHTHMQCLSGKTNVHIISTCSICGILASQVQVHIRSHWQRHQRLCLYRALLINNPDPETNTT